MKEIKSKNRIVRFFMDDDHVVISENTAHLPTGHTKRKWDESRVALSRDELVKALAFMDSMERD